MIRRQKSVGMRWWRSGHFPNSKNELMCVAVVDLSLQRLTHRLAFLIWPSAIDDVSCATVMKIGTKSTVIATWCGDEDEIAFAAIFIFRRI
jgi:hypothetical protein